MHTSIHWTQCIDQYTHTPPLTDLWYSALEDKVGHRGGCGVGGIENDGHHGGSGGVEATLEREHYPQSILLKRCHTGDVT